MFYTETDYTRWAEELFSELEDCSVISNREPLRVSSGYFFNISSMFETTTNKRFMANLFFSQQSILIHVSEKVDNVDVVCYENKVPSNYSTKEVIRDFKKFSGM